MPAYYDCRSIGRNDRINARRVYLVGKVISTVNSVKGKRAVESAKTKTLGVIDHQRAASSAS